MTTHPFTPAVAAGARTAHATYRPVILRHYGRLTAEGSDHQTRASWRGDVAYAKAMPFVPWLLALPACFAIAIVQTFVVDGQPWSATDFVQDVFGYALLLCAPGWILAFVLVRLGVWLYGRSVRTSLVLTFDALACDRHSPLGTTVLVPAGSRVTAVWRDEHVERVRTRHARYTLARQAFVRVQATDPTGRHHDVEIGHGLDDEGRHALEWMLRQLIRV